jgi:hypothetical protein
MEADMNRVALIVIALVIAGQPSAVSAQSDGRLSVVGAIEYARITEDDSYLGAGFGAMGGLQYHLTEATSAGVEISRERHVRDFGLFAVAHDAAGRAEVFPYTRRWEGAATFVLGVVSHAFGSARARPVMWIGGGLMSHGGTTRGPLAPPQIPPGFTLQPGAVETTRGRSATAVAADGGVGLEVRVPGRLTVGPFAGLRLVHTGNFGPKYIVRGGVRIAFRP